MAPEVIGKYDTQTQPSVDVWALGCILYEMITGAFAFQGKGDDLKKNILKGVFHINDILSVEALNLLSLIFNYDHKKRISIIDIYNHKWMKGEQFQNNIEFEKTYMNWKDTNKMYKAYEEIKTNKHIMESNQNVIKESNDQNLLQKCQADMDIAKFESIKENYLKNLKSTSSDDSLEEKLFKRLNAINNDKSPKKRILTKNIGNFEQSSNKNSKKPFKELVKEREELILKQLSINSYSKNNKINIVPAIRISPEQTKSKALNIIIDIDEFDLKKCEIKPQKKQQRRSESMDNNIDWKLK